jgi:hypothetical protein
MSEGDEDEQARRAAFARGILEAETEDAERYRRDDRIRHTRAGFSFGEWSVLAETRSDSRCLVERSGFGVRCR